MVLAVSIGLLIPNQYIPLLYDKNFIVYVLAILSIYPEKLPNTNSKNYTAGWILASPYFYTIMFEILCSKTFIIMYHTLVIPNGILGV